MEGRVYAKHYRLTKKLGSGAFGQIWKAVHEKTKEEVAIKFEDVNSKHQQLYYECKIYLWFHSDSTVIGQAIPQVLYYGTESNNNLMVMDLLGKSLEDLFNVCGRKFSLKTVLMMAHQMIKRVEYIHSRRIIHRDIKPDNFAVGRDRHAHRIFIIDFGLAKKFMSSDGKHIKYKDGKSLTGTARYASINTHIGIEQARRDDMEGLGYVFMYFLRGKLPWQGLRAKGVKEKYEKIKQKKIMTNLEDLCKGFPDEFVAYMQYCRTLNFEDKPDYRYIKNLFGSLFKNLGYEYDWKYDWLLAQESSTKKDE